MRATSFHGWHMVLSCLLVQAVAGGITIYLFSLFAGEVERAFEARRATVMLAATGHALVSAVVGPKLGQLMDTRRLRGTMTICAALLGLGFLLIPLVPSVWGFVGGFAVLVAIASAGLATLFTPVLLSRWFVRKRGLALGIAALGSQLGGFVLSPLAALLIRELGWGPAMQIIGVFAFLVIASLMRWVVIDRPEDCGEFPDGDPASAPGRGAQAEPAAGGAALTDVLRDANFWIAAIGIGLVLAVFAAVLTNLSLFATDIGASLEAAARLISLFALVGIVTSPLIGRACDLVDIRLVFAGIVVMCAAALLAYAAAESYAGLAVATAILAAVGGGVSPFIGALVGRLFDARVYGRAIGSLFLVAVGVSSLVPLASGLLFDAVGSYRALFHALALLLLLPLAGTAWLRLRPERSSSLAR